MLAVLVMYHSSQLYEDCGIQPHHNGGDKARALLRPAICAHAEGLWTTIVAAGSSSSAGRASLIYCQEMDGVRRTSTPRLNV